VEAVSEAIPLKDERGTAREYRGMGATTVEIKRITPLKI
jgi:hypothetical protein